MTFALLVVVLASLTFVQSQKLISLEESAAFTVEIPSCTQDFGDAKVSQRCKSLVCARRVEDGLFTKTEIERLHRVAKKGMSHRKAVGGPTILDINTGTLTKSRRKSVPESCYAHCKLFKSFRLHPRHCWY